MRKEKIVARWFTVLKACRNKLQPVDYRLNKIKRHDQVFFVFRGLCKAIHPLRKKFSFPYLNKEQVVLSLCFFISKLWNHHALLTLQERARVSLQIYQVCDQIMILTVSCSEFRSFFALKKWGNEECAKLDMHKACDLVFLWSLLNFKWFWTYMAVHLLQSGIHKCATHAHKILLNTQLMSRSVTQVRWSIFARIWSFWTRTK